MAIGIIGGSGLYDMDSFVDREELAVETPFGPPSDNLIRGTIAGHEVFFLPRHGRGHRISPTQLPFRANIYALKKVGVTSVLSVSAVGSLREEIVPGHLVLVDQFIDRTRERTSTFFSDGIAAHVGFADPTCGRLLQVLVESARNIDSITCHSGGTYVCMEGPQFSTRAESHMYRSWGANVVGMTNLQEAKLAREAELCYQTIALATDYDCWHESEEDVDVAAVIATLRSNVDKAKALLQAAIPVLAKSERVCPCKDALAHAVMTSPQLIPPATFARLELLLGRYVPTPAVG